MAAFGSTLSVQLLHLARRRSDLRPRFGVTCPRRFDSATRRIREEGATRYSLAHLNEYSPYGELLRATGAYAQVNSFQFSSKYTDIETGYVYYGRRYYNPALGRFIGRDPKMEKGGLHLYGFLGNNGINRWDYLGMDGSSDWTTNYLQSLGLDPNANKNSTAVNNNMAQTAWYNATYGKYNSGGGGIMANFFNPTIGSEDTNFYNVNMTDPATVTLEAVNKNPPPPPPPPPWGIFDVPKGAVSIGPYVSPDTGSSASGSSADPDSADSTLASFGPGDLAHIPTTYSTESLLVIQNPDGTVSVPTAPIKDYQAGILGTPGTAGPIIVPPDIDPNEFVWAGQYVAGNSPIPGGASTTIFSMFNPAFGYNPKMEGPQYDQWGNVAFGLTGTEAGLSQGELQSGGVVGQIMAHGNFSNSPANQAAIQDGINLANAINSGSTVVLLPMPPPPPIPPGG